MSSLTLTTWTCERCSREVVTDSADSPPKYWLVLTLDIDGTAVERDLCSDCGGDAVSFLHNKTVEHREPSK